MDETTLIAGGVTVHDDGDIVTATNENTPAPIAAPVVEAEVPPAEPEPEPEPKEEAVEAEREDNGRFKSKDDADRTVDRRKPIEKKGESYQARIDRLRYEQGEEERRLDRLRQEREHYERTFKPSTTPPPVASPGSTTFKDFVVEYAAKNPNATYEDAIDAFQVVREDALLARLESKTKQDSESKEVETLMTAHRERLAALTAATPELDAAIRSTQAFMELRGFANLPPALFGAIIRSDKSAEIVKHLSMHPEMTYQAALDAKDLPATPAAVKLMRTVLESALGTNGSPAPSSGPGQPLRQSRSNPPPKPVGNSPVASASSDDEPSYEQVLERVTKHLHRR